MDVMKNIDKALKYWFLLTIVVGIITLIWFFASAQTELAAPTFLFSIDFPLSLLVSLVLVFPVFYILFRTEFIKRKLKESDESAGRWVVFQYLFMFIAIIAIIGIGSLVNPILSFIKIETGVGATLSLSAQIGTWIGALLSITIAYFFRNK